ncbi:MAG: chemotaxis protein CheX [Lachnospiraceae bacterium]|nr:chemotaxis protein CheX [Lachnospiraceae bacterium]
MFTQFFGNYLLNQKLVTPEQLVEAMQEKNNTRMKLGVLAINAGYMTASQVERVHELQSKMDKRIGDIAVELGYMTEEQVMELLHAQPLGYLLLGQAIVDKGYMSNSEFEDAINSYKEKFSLTDDDIANNEDSKVSNLISSLYDFSKTSNPELYKEFVSLLMNNLVRFVGDDFTPLKPEYSIESTAFKYTSQTINGEFSINTSLFADEPTLIEFACRYSGEDITELDEYAEASGQDFTNLHNGLFTVNVSNIQQMELTLTPPTALSDLTNSDVENCIILPFQYPFGTIRFSVSL